MLDWMDNKPSPAHLHIRQTTKFIWPKRMACRFCQLYKLWIINVCVTGDKHLRLHIRRSLERGKSERGRESESEKNTPLSKSVYYIFMRSNDFMPAHLSESEIWMICFYARFHVGHWQSFILLWVILVAVWSVQKLMPKNYQKRQTNN